MEKQVSNQLNGVASRLYLTVQRMEDILSTIDTLYIAVSGGIDSVVLLHALFEVKEVRDWLPSLKIVHVNHMLRGAESDGDMSFVQSLAEKYDLEVITTEIDVGKVWEKEKGSIQQIARTCRYSFFSRLLDETHSILCTAHNLDDQVETMMMRMIKGTSIRGLAGIREQRGRFIRPMLNCSRKEIEEYYWDNELIHREDSSNAKDVYTRNNIRHNLIPLMESVEPSFLTHFSRLAKTLTRENYCLEDLTNKLIEEIVTSTSNGYVFKKASLKSVDPALKYRLFEALFRKCVPLSTGITTAHLEQCIEFLDSSSTSKVIHLPEGVSIKCQYGSLYFIKEDVISEKKILQLELEIKELIHGAALTLPNSGGQLLIKLSNSIAEPKIYKKNIACLDIDKIKLPLTLRYSADGDYMTPLGMNGKKKLNRLFIDDKIPIEDRLKLPLLCKDSEILWIFGHRISDRFKVTEDTCRVVIFEWRRT